MKTNAIIRIVIYSILILLILAIGVGIFAGGYWGFPIYFRMNGGQSEGSVGVISESGNGNPLMLEQDIHAIRIQCDSGEIRIQSGDVKNVVIEEYVSDNKQSQKAVDSTGELTISYPVSRFHFGNFIPSAKKLVITIPNDKAMNRIALEVASADVVISDVTGNIDLLEFDGASGTCLIENCEITKMDVDTASGDVTFSGSLDALDFDSASAKFRGVFTNSPHSIIMDVMSGDMDLTLPEACGFTVKMDGLSSNFTSEYPTSGSAKTYIYGNGSCQIDIDAMSANLNIHRA